MPNILSLTSPGTELLAYPANEGGIGERWPHIVELEVVHVVEELWGEGRQENQGLSRDFSLPLITSFYFPIFRLHMNT